MIRNIYTTSYDYYHILLVLYTCFNSLGKDTKIKKDKKVWSTYLSKVGEVSKVAKNDPDPGMGISRPFFSYFVYFHYSSSIFSRHAELVFNINDHKQLVDTWWMYFNKLLKLRNRYLNTHLGNRTVK